MMCFPPSPSVVHCPEQCGQDKWHHTPVSGDRSCKCLLRESLLTSLLTQAAQIQETAPPVLPCIPNPSICWVISLYLPAFPLLTSFTGSGHHSVGHPKLSWTGALAALPLLLSQLMGSWQPFSLYKDKVQAALWCCQAMTSTGLPADSFALSPWEQKATGKMWVLCQAPGQSGFRLCCCVQQTACPVLDLCEGCFHLLGMLCISGCST